VEVHLSEPCSMDIIPIPPLVPAVVQAVPGLGSGCSSSSVVGREKQNGLLTPRSVKSVPEGECTTETEGNVFGGMMAIEDALENLSRSMSQPSAYGSSTPLGGGIVGATPNKRKRFTTPRSTGYKSRLMSRRSRRLSGIDVSLLNDDEELLGTLEADRFVRKSIVWLVPEGGSEEVPAFVVGWTKATDTYVMKDILKTDNYIQGKVTRAMSMKELKCLMPSLSRKSKIFLKIERSLRL